MDGIDDSLTGVESLMQYLCHSKKLERDKGVTILQRFVSNTDDSTIASLQEKLKEAISNEESPWETKHGCLLGLKALFSPFNLRNDQCHTTKEILSEPFDEDLVNLCLKLLTDEEVRVRLATGELLGVLCEIYGSVIYERCSCYVLSLIKENLDREIKEVQSDEQEKFRDHIGGTIIRRGSIDKKQIFHDTAGWKCLETSMKCFQSMVDGCGINFRPYIDTTLLELLFQAMTHTNRFVRETSCYVIGSLVSCGTAGQSGEQCIHNKDNHKNEPSNPFTIDRYGHIVAQKLAIGLTDNWSQVRLAASEATRKFLLSFTNEEDREAFYPEILPQMCLNRYYVADGVRIYSQETWRRIAKTEGRELVQKHIKHVVNYYISQTNANNHAVREAACACIAELASKIKSEVVQPFVPALLETLLVCFQDDSWPVRDAACLASGNFVLCYPNESREIMKKLYPLFIDNLKDCIPSVRQGAAGSLANVARAYGDEALEVLNSVAKEGLEGIEQQPSESEKYGKLEKGPATFGLAKRLRDNDEDLHTDKQMYSCGSLAPKMGRGGGCSDHKFKKDPEPWEFADGCLHLVAELAQLPEVAKKMEVFLPLIAKACQKKHYAHHLCLLETLCKRLPNIGKGIGKREFKQHLELFLDSLFYSLSCDNALTSSAASQCLNQLSSFLGLNILRARIQEYNPSYVQLFDGNTHIAAF